MSSNSPEVEAEEDEREAVQGLPSVDSIFVADSQVQSPGSQPGGSFSVWRSFYNVALRSFFWSSTKCLIHPGLDHLLQEMLGAVQVFHSQVVIAKGETLLVRNLLKDIT